MVVIAGCGYVGGRLADLLHERGVPVTGLTHSADSAARLSAEKAWPVMACDISDAAAVKDLALQLGAERVDALVHCASSSRGGAEVYRQVYVEGMRHLLGAFPRAFPVFTSSSSVYAQTDGSTVTEESPAEPERETGQLLRQAEELALARGGAVARLAGIYGPGRSFVLKNLLLGKAAVEDPVANGPGRILNQIHRDDAAAALAHLVEGRRPGVFNVVDDLPMPQSDCLSRLAANFHLPAPPWRLPDAGRKRGWTNKAVSNAHLRSTGWKPRFSDYFEALAADADLIPSLLQQVQEEAPDALLRTTRNVVLIGLMGSGKTTVGRHIAQMLNFQFVDTDALIVEAAGMSIPRIFESEGEAGFRLRESAVLRGLIGRTDCVIATGGGIVTQPRNHAVLRHIGYIVWLEASPALLHRRTSSSTDRPLLHGEEDPRAKLERLLRERSPLYTALAHLRVPTDELNPLETAYGIAESARVFFSRVQTGPA